MKCESNFDCGTDAYCAPTGRCETECFIDEDCRSPPECQSNPTACVPRGLRCNGSGRCIAPRGPDRRGTTIDIDIDRLPDRIQGWDDPPGSGPIFIFDRITVADRNQGFDVDGVCSDSAGCIDNYLWRMGGLSNDRIRRGLAGGETLLLMELAGLDQPYRGDDESLTVKIYGARDADEPPFPGNDFKIPANHQTCCEFRIDPRSLAGSPRQARARAPARIERGRLRSLLPVDIQFTLTVGVPPHPEIRIERMLLSGRLPANLGSVDDGVLGGAIPINTLAQTENPYCRTVSAQCPVRFEESTLVDLVSTLLGNVPDIDLDGDGQECTQDTDGDGQIDRCCDGAGALPSCVAGRNACLNGGAAIPPSDSLRPWTCALDPRLGDGYSVGITFSAVRATIVGIGR